MTRGDIREVCSVLNDIALHLGTRQGNGERQSISENLHTITQFLGNRMTDLREAPLDNDVDLEQLKFSIVVPIPLLSRFA